MRPVRAFSDNYIWLIESPTAAALLRWLPWTQGEAELVIAHLKRGNLKLAAILLTHHHPDHIGGVPELLRLGKVPVIGPDDKRNA